jgi:hypothetical protein
MIPALGGAERKLGQVAFPDYFTDGLAWSPDGKYLAVFDKAHHEPYSIYLLSVETGAKRKLTFPPAEYVGDWSQRFSPHGKTLAFVRNYSHRGELYTLPVTSDWHPGGEPRRLTFDERQIFGIDWTGDGQRILYSSGQDGSTNMFSIASSGGTPERVAVPADNPTAISRRISNPGTLPMARRSFSLRPDPAVWRSGCAIVRAAIRFNLLLSMVRMSEVPAGHRTADGSPSTTPKQAPGTFTSSAWMAASRAA